MLLTFFSTCSSPRLGMLFCSSARVRPCCWECSFHPLRVRSSLPAVGPLFSSRRGSALLCPPWDRSFLPAVGPLSSTRRGSALFFPPWVRSSGFLSPASSNLAMYTQTAGFALRAILAPWRRWLRVRQSHSASAELTPPVQCEALVSSRTYATSRNPSPVHMLTHVFSSARSLTCCAWSGSSQPTVSTLRALRVKRLCLQELGCSGSLSFFSAWSWTPLCRVCGHSCASPGTPRRWSLCLEGLLSSSQRSRADVWSAGLISTIRFPFQGLIVEVFDSRIMALIRHFTSPSSPVRSSLRG